MQKGGKQMKKIILAGLLLLGSVAMANATTINFDSTSNLWGKLRVAINCNNVCQYMTITVCGN
jgi:hypothetical protein